MLNCNHLKRPPLSPYPKLRNLWTIPIIKGQELNRISAPCFYVVLCHLQSCSTQRVHTFPSYEMTFLYIFENVNSFAIPVWSTKVTELKFLIAKADLGDDMYILQISSRGWLLLYLLVSSFSFSTLHRLIKSKYSKFLLERFLSAYISELNKGLFHVEIFRQTGLFTNCDNR